MRNSPVTRTEFDLIADEIKALKDRALRLENEHNPTQPVILSGYSDDNIDGQIIFAPPAQMGAVVGGPNLGTGLTNGLRLRSGVLYTPNPPMVAGDSIVIDYFGRSTRFDWMAARVHVITGLTRDAYDPRQPWESDPWNGGTGSPSATDPYPVFGGWHGFVTFSATTNDDGELVTWTLPDDGATPEDYAFDDTGVGHIGYLLHDFGASRVVGDVTVAYSGASTERQGSIIFNKSAGAVTVGAVIGEDDSTNTNQLVVELTADVPDGSDLLVVVASCDPDEVVDDGQVRPNITPLYASVSATRQSTIPHVYYDGSFHPVAFHDRSWSGAGSGTGGGGVGVVDGGSP